jgi:peptidylprolyl isomerase
MRKTSPIALSFVTLLCLSSLFLTRSACGASAGPAPAPAGAPGQAQDPNVGPAKDTAAVVARLGDYTILRKELEERLVRDLRPGEEEFPAPIKPVTAAGTLRGMLAEKAMSLEGRKLGYLKDETIRPGIEEFEQQQMARTLLDRQFRDRLKPEAADVDRALKANPKLTRDQATMVARQALAMRLFDAFYNELTQKFHLKKVSEHFAQAAKIHERLLQRPVKPRGPSEFWILNQQIQDDLTEEERNLVLATYDGGQFTLKDWLLVICNMAPPRRPQDLSTPAGVEKLLNGALRLPLLVAEAKARGYDKDEEVRSAVRRLEDQQLFAKIRAEKIKGIREPTAEQIKAYFEKNQERFAQAATVKISQIWCESLEAAQKVKAALAGGNDFETAKKVHSLQKEETPHLVTAASEGLFWAELWKADPNQIVGPLRGFYGSGLKWRMVKILEKTSAKAQPYSERLANSIKWTLLADQQQRVLEEYRAELLKKYPYEIFGERIKDMDPLEIATNRQDK